MCIRDRRILRPLVDVCFCLLRVFTAIVLLPIPLSLAIHQKAKYREVHAHTPDENKRKNKTGTVYTLLACMNGSNSLSPVP